MQRNLVIIKEFLIRYSRYVLFVGCLFSIEHSFSKSFPGDSLKQKVRIADPKLITFREIAPLPPQAKEASGLEITNSNSLWTHNDGGVPALFEFDTLGNLVRTLHLNHINAGWEDLAQDDAGNIYIGAFGNNKNNRKNLKIYKIANPGTIKEPVVNGEIIHFSYEDQQAFPPPKDQLNFDMDAMVFLNKSLYLFSKNRTTPFNGYTKVYKLPTDPGDHKAILFDSLFLGVAAPYMNFWVTGADISPDRKTIVLLGHHRLWLIRNFEGKKFSQATIYQVDLGHFSHKAGICFRDNQSLYIVDELEMEMLGGKLYSVDISRLLRTIK